MRRAPRHYILVVVYVLHLFLSCHVIKHFSTVSWVLSQVVASVIAVCVSDPALHRYRFGQRALPSLLIAPTIVLSAIIFQTGRRVGRCVHRARACGARREPAWVLGEWGCAARAQ